MQHYEIDLEVDVEGNHVQGQTTIYAETTQDLDAFNLNFMGMEISSLLVNGTDAEFCRDDSGELTIFLPRLLSERESFMTSVSYHGTPMNFDYPGSIRFGWVKTDEGVFTSGPPNSPSYLYPNNEYTNKRATYTIILTVPEGYQASTVGSLDESIQKDGQVTTTWNQKAPSPSIVFNIDRVSIVKTFIGPEGLPIRFQYPASLEYWFEETIQDIPEYLEYFSSIYGPFPFDQFGIVVVSSQVLSISMPTLIFINSADP